MTSIVLAGLLPAPGLAAADPPIFLLKWGTGGAGDAEFNQPFGIGAGPFGDLYVADTGNHRIQRFSGNGAFLTKWGAFGTGPGQFNQPLDVAVDGSGNVLVADRFNQRIQKFDGSGAYIAEWITPGGVGPTKIGVAPSGDIFYVTEYQHVHKYTTGGLLLLTWRTSSDVESSNGGIAVGTSGAVYVVDTGLDLLRKYGPNGEFIGQWGGSGTGDGQFLGASGVAVDADENVYVSDGDGVQKFTSSGGFLTRWGTLGSKDGQFGGAVDLAIDADGSIFVVDKGNNRVQKFGYIPTATAPSTWGRLKSLYRQPENR